MMVKLRMQIQDAEDKIIEIREHKINHLAIPSLMSRWVGESAPKLKPNFTITTSILENDE